MNIRDIASINELAIPSNIESMNAEMIRKGIAKNERFKQLNEVAEYQLNVLNKKDSLKALKKLSDEIYFEKNDD